MAHTHRDRPGYESESSPLIQDGSINDVVDGTAVTPPKKLPMAVVAIMLLAVQAGFGGYGIMLRKFCGELHANALVVSFYRDALAFPVLLIAARVIEGPLKFPRHRRDLALFCGLGLTGMFGGQLFYILGVFYAGPDVASVLQPAMPVWTAIFVVIAGVEAIPNVCELKGLMKVFGVLCAAGGAATMLLSKGKASEYPKPLLGAMFSLINTVLFALYITIQKLAIFSPKGSCHAKWNSTPLYVTAWSYGFGAVFMVLGGLGGYYTHLGLFGFEADFGHCGLNETYLGEGCSGQNSTATDATTWKYTCVGSSEDGQGECHAHSNTLTLPPTAWYALAYAVFITSALNYGLISIANKNCRTSVVSAFWPVQVFVSIGLAYIVFNDRLVLVQYVGGVLIVFGLFLVLKSDVDNDDETKTQGSSKPSAKLR
eukprot:m.134182 g.134182  ORF g.134182 m.134182 type:complete len:427 (-) comp22526_c1_seq2:121-1401(-)